MKNNKLTIYLVIALFLVMGIGYAFLNQNVELDNDVTISSYEKQGVPAPYDITILSGQKGNLQAGDKIRIGQSEDFYVISSDNSENGKTVLLAKYNLLVGNIVENGSVTGQIQSNAEGYGLQSDTARGIIDGSDWTGIATVSFSSSTYWMPYPPLSILEAYSENGAIYYDQNTGSFKHTADDTTARAYVFDSNSDIYQYINGNDGYVEKLKTMGAPSTITGRLLKFSEADSVKEVTDGGQSIIFTGYQSYWLGTSPGYSIVDFIFAGNSNFSASGSQVNSMNGIRPVIEINTSDI